MAHMVFDTRFKTEMEGLDEPPFDSDFGQKIFKNVSKKSWGEWVERPEDAAKRVSPAAMDAGGPGIPG